MVLIVVDSQSGDGFANFPQVQWMRQALIVYSGLMVSYAMWNMFELTPKLAHKLAKFKPLRLGND
ncbi:hypothetical protein FLM48_01070 [Shewanella sp. Scap07]|uniref:hypothetical protein n=1 Tax=Shewanella sp. Scap07 TaxID=2589987 RepID=UPI0015BE6E2B|nr:hypothetical protein [Shewanella sp. Scap07]QLE83803.1 hypothetical protein FLM48_01070 [Shewanella sp. Scap07]